MTDSFYKTIERDRYRSTERTVGPWGTRSQHAGPPSSLLGRAVEAVDDRGDLQVARITFDILKPVPIEDLTVSATIERDGRSVQLVHASLRAGDVEVMRASAWRIKTQPLDLAGNADPPPGPPADGSTADISLWPGTNYLTSMEGRFLNGGFQKPGPARAWMRSRVPLVDDEPNSPLTRVLIAADSASGISSELDFRDWVFINPDLSVYLHRYPESDWVLLDARTTLQPHGVGTARSTIYDERGAIGASLQSLYLTPRA